ncbi:von Willebrand factor type A domain-containing protein [Micromonospora pallida]|uniref:von Willebrand factor type A domain-containing protein n=1 Tax=Micromonospora pallida TaxID=145854 RepID=A0A1C6TJ42_9ACTN|nr:VWA domain-containing protein [Micromonospora pallida]SCL41565.1 von Willebrand factor type A domain-containing protein [Micromonospora pallida]
MRSGFRGAGAVASATALAVVATGAWFGYREFTGPACSGQVKLTVAAAPEIAPVVQAAAGRWVAEGAAVDGTCVAVEVSTQEPVEVAAAVAGKHGVTLPGVGQASGTAITPDVWVPDSSTWLLRIKNSGAAAFDPTNGASIARSPVVVAMPEPVATRLGWPQQKLTWADLVRQMNTDTKLRTGIVEPTRDAAGLAGLLALTAAAGKSGRDSQQARTAALRALATGRSALRQDLLARFPRSTDPAALAAGLGAAALSEEDVIAYNRTQPPVPLAALYLDPAPMALDYPYAVLPGIEPAKASAAAGLFGALTAPTFPDRLVGQALRGPDGVGGAGFQAPVGAPAGGPAPLAAGGGTAAGGPDPSALDAAVSGWSVATQSGRMLCVIDVSGSMRQPVPTAGNVSREQVTVAAALRGLDLVDDSWAVGLWTFSTEMVGSRDYRELLPIGPLSTQRSKLRTALGSIRPTQDGDTGLYDTVLAAYRTVQDDWEPGRVNSLVLFTDGKNEDADGIGQRELLTELARLADPERPVQVVIIGIGGDVSRTELEAITKVTGGGVFVTEDPNKIGEIFLRAVALRPTAPR